MKAPPHAQLGWRLGKAGRVDQTLAHCAQGLEHVANHRRVNSRPG